MILYEPRWSPFYAHAWTRTCEVWGSRRWWRAATCPTVRGPPFFDASERDYRIALVTDATSQVTPQRLDDLSLIGVTVVRTDQVGVSLTSAS